MKIDAKNIARSERPGLLMFGLPLLILAMGVGGYIALSTILSQLGPTSTTLASLHQLAQSRPYYAEQCALQHQLVAQEALFAAFNDFKVALQALLLWGFGGVALLAYFRERHIRQLIKRFNKGS